MWDTDSWFEIDLNDRNNEVKPSKTKSNKFLEVAKLSAVLSGICLMFVVVMTFQNEGKKCQKIHFLRDSIVTYSRKQYSEREFQSF